MRSTSAAALYLFAVAPACGRLGFEAGAPADAGPEPPACAAAPCVPTTGWAQRFGTDAVDYGFDVAVDRDLAQLYLTGLFASTIDYGVGPMIGNGFHDIPLVAFGLDGSPRWSRQIGGAGFDEAFGLALAPGGAIAVIGRASTLTLAGTMYPGDNDVLVAYAPPDGGTVQGRLLGGDDVDGGADRGHGVALSSAGDTCIAAAFQDSVDFGAGPKTSMGGDDGFIGCYAAGGVPRWMHHFGAAGDDDAAGIVIDEARNQVVVAATATGELTFAGVPVSARGSADALVAALGLDDGGLRWIVQLGGDGPDGVNDLALGLDGEIYVHAFHGGPLTFAGVEIPHQGGDDILLARIDADGTPRWARAHGGPNDERPIRIAVGPDGAMLSTGYFEGTSTIGGVVVTSAGDGDIFVLATETTGAPRWLRTFGGVGDDDGQGLAADAQGRVYVTGAFTPPVDFGTGPLSNPQDPDGLETFLIRLDPP